MRWGESESRGKKSKDLDWGKEVEGQAVWAGQGLRDPRIKAGLGEHARPRHRTHVTCAGQWPGRGAR